MAMFVNTRVLHGRQGFGAGESRLLEGVYVGLDETRSRLRVLARRYGLLPAPEWFTLDIDGVF